MSHRKIYVDDPDAEPFRARTLVEQLKVLLLTPDRRQQIRLSQSGLANLLMLGCVAMANMLSAGGIADGHWVPAWTAISVGGMLGIFATIRSGRIKHWQDPSLTLVQMFFAVTCAAVGYCIMGEARAVVIPILAVILMFGMFGMTRRQVVAVGLYSILVFGVASIYWIQIIMATRSRRPELANLMMVSIVVGGVIVLTGRLQDLRLRLRQQREALSDALVQIGELATKDELTGCLNRRTMLERIAEEYERIKRGDVACVAILDLDHFKRINDEFGHSAGDTVLKGFADTARRQLRASDAMARWGGEEFLLLLGRADIDHAEICVQRLLDELSKQEFSCKGGQIAVTCSAGLAQGSPGESIAELIERCDRALYSAKNAGRNRLVTHRGELNRSRS